MRTLLAVLLLGSLGAPACAQLKDTPTPKESRRTAFWKSVGSTAKERFKAAAKLKAGKPVDDLQASLLADVYFNITFGGCGGTGEPVDKGTYWLFPTAIGYSAESGPQIRVNKATGITSCTGHKTIADPRIYAKWAK